MITLSHYHKDERGNLVSTVSYTVHEDMNVSDIMQQFKYFLLACSYPPESVNKYIEEE